MATIQVFGSPTSSEVARVLACLFEKNVEFQLIRVDAFKGLEKKPEFLKLQPCGQALTFDDGKTVLVDSREICRHIAQKYADRENKDLLGTGTLERASIEQWLRSEAISFEPPSSKLVYNLAFPPELGQEYDEKVIEESKKKLDSVLEVYEQRLQETPYLAGDKFTLADLSHLPNTHRLMETDCASLFTKRQRVKKWWDAISRRDSWKRVVAMQKAPSE